MPQPEAAQPAGGAKPPGKPQTFDITSPDGRKLSITGDHMPTELELNNIFAAVPKPGGKPNPQAGDFGKLPPVPQSGKARFTSAAAGFLGNVNPVTAVEGLASAVMHPSATLDAMREQSAAEWSKSMDALAEGRYSEMVGHGAAALLPGIGPASAHAGESIAQGDVAGGLGEAAGLLAPDVLPRGAAKATKHLPKQTRERVAAAAERGSTRRIADVMSPKVGANKMRFGAKAAKIAPQLAREPGLNAFSRTGFQRKISQGAEASLDELNAVADERNAGKVYETEPILTALKAKRDKLTAMAVEGSQYTPGEGLLRKTAAKDAARAEESAALEKATTRPAQTPFQQWQANKARGPSSVADMRTDVPISATGRAEFRRMQAEGEFRGPRPQGGADQLRKMQAEDARAAAREGVSSEFGGTSAAGGPPPVKRKPIGQNVVPAPNRRQFGILNRAIREVETLGPIARYESLRRIRQAYDKVAKPIYNPSVTVDFLKRQGEQYGASDIAGAIRDHLGVSEPATAAANAKFSLYKSAHDIVRATEEVERSRPGVGRQLLSRLTGGVIGVESGGLIGGLAGMVLAPTIDAALKAAPTTKIATARVLATLADALRSGNMDRVTKIATQLMKINRQANVTGQAVDQAQGRLPPVPGTVQ